MEISVVICTHNPDPARIERALSGLRAQTLPTERWDCVVVDNGSDPSVRGLRLPNLRIVSEPRLGLSWARRRGLAESSTPLCVFVDDDNVLAPDYLSKALSIARDYPRMGAFGGRSVGEFETPPSPWHQEFLGLLAVRDLGPVALSSSKQDSPSAYPMCAPIGAGMVLRREAARAWLEAPPNAIVDRRGSDLTSGGDNDMVLTAIGAGWDVGYFPDLTLTHLIPASRLSASYLARLNMAIQRSWVRVLSAHGIRPWTPIARWTVPARTLRSWARHRAWRGAVETIRWQGARGLFLGRSEIPRK